MPNRMLRDWTDSLKFEAMPAESERLFVRLIMKADDFGRFHSDPRLVRAACYPLEDCTTAKVEHGLAELAKRGLTYAYTVEGRGYIAIINYGQRLKQSRPKFPPPDGEPGDWRPTSGNFRELPARREDEGEYEGEERRNDICPPSGGPINQSPAQKHEPKPKTFKGWTAAEFEAEVERCMEGVLDPHEARRFLDYWSETSASGRMKFSLQQTWETKRRMFTWRDNNLRRS